MLCKGQEQALISLYFQGATLSCNNLHESWVIVLQPFWRSFKVFFGCFQTSPATWHITDSLSLGTLLLGAFCKSASFAQLSGSTGCQYVGRCSGERLQPSDKHSGGFRVVRGWSAASGLEILFKLMKKWEKKRSFPDSQQLYFSTYQWPQTHWQ